MKIKFLVLIIMALALQACEEQPLMAVGQLESDRVEIITESNEPIIAISVMEGDAIESGDAMLAQDTTRFVIRIEEAVANIQRIEAQLEELQNGPRRETIDATRASLKEAQIDQEFRIRDFDRLTGLRERDLTSVESVDNAERLLESAGARIERITAQLAELEAGTRPEQIAQFSNALLQARTQLKSLEFDRDRLTTKAPVEGLVDSLPFEIGERPRQGDIVAVMLTGEQPFARIYVPEPLRASVSVGDELSVNVDGVANPVSGTVRRIAAEPIFTPYFALTERDRSRLAYVAEVTLANNGERLPEGLPVQVLFE